MDDFSLRELEDTIFRAVSEIARNVTRMVLEALDEQLMNSRDKIRYEVIRKVQTTVKMKYGEVEYGRRYYKDHINKEKVFLLDKLTEGDRLGLYSTGAVEMVLKACAEMSYQKAAEHIKNNTALTISKTECWNIVQEFSEVIDNYLEKQLPSDDKKDVNILYEEADGVWLFHQGKNHKKEKSMEVKVVTLYDGWNEDNTKRLVNKTVIGGNCSAADINKKTEAVIDSLYNIDEINTIVLNGDGASWIDGMAGKDMIYQIDRFHVMKYITKAIKDRKILKRVKKSLKENDITKMLDLIETYMNSIDDGSNDKQVKIVKDTLRYLQNHKDNIIYYHERPEFQEFVEDGKIYKNMGVQENQNCTVITLRMKHRRMRWGYSGADAMVKLRCVIENGWLSDIIKQIDGRYTRRKTDIDPDEIIDKAFESAAPYLKSVGSGSRYFDQSKVSIPLLGSAKTSLSTAIRGLSGLA